MCLVNDLDAHACSSREGRVESGRREQPERRRRPWPRRSFHPALLPSLSAARSIFALPHCAAQAPTVAAKDSRLVLWPGSVAHTHKEQARSRATLVFCTLLDPNDLASLRAPIAYPRASAGLRGEAQATADGKPLHGAVGRAPATSASHPAQRACQSSSDRCCYRTGLSSQPLRLHALAPFPAPVPRSLLLAPLPVGRASGSRRGEVQDSLARHGM